MTAITASASTAPTTRTLLTAGAAAGPLWAAVSLTQAATRAGFDIRQDPLSLLSTGDLGWVQITNFVVAGVLLLAGAAGLRRVVPGRWVPRLTATAGAGLIAAGVLVMDPVISPGTPMSWHSVGHMVAGTITFTSLIAVCYVLARHCSGAGRALAVAAGTALLLGDLWAMTGGALGSLTLAAGAISAMLYLSAFALRARNGSAASGIQEG
jgi:hypothetical protein